MLILYHTRYIAISVNGIASIYPMTNNFAKIVQNSCKENCMYTRYGITPLFKVLQYSWMSEVKH